MAHPLDGVRAKLDRAREHEELLNWEMNSFMEGGPDKPFGWLVTLDHDVGQGHVIWRKPPSIPLRFPTILGDFLHCLRSALDHLAWQLVIANGGTPTPNTEFPVFQDEHKFDRPRNEPTKTRGMSEPVRAAIRGLQPFSVSPEAPEHSTLWVIHNLNAIDKHRLLHAADIWFTTFQLRFTLSDGPEYTLPITPDFIAPRQRLIGDTELARFSWSPDELRSFSEQQVKMEFMARLDISLSESGEFPSDSGEVVGGLPIYALMDLTLEHMDKTVLPRFEPFFK